MDELNKVYQDKEGMLLTNLYGYITMLDIDQAQVSFLSVINIMLVIEYW